MATFLNQKATPDNSGEPTTQGKVNQQYLDMVNSLNVPTSTSESTPASGEGFSPFSVIGNTVKDAANTVVVQPGVRVAQAGVQTYNEFQNPGYDTPADTGNPQRQNAGGAAAPLPLNAPAAGVNTSNSEAAMRQSVDTLGVTTAPQQSGAAGAKQIAGDALKSFAYLYGGEGLAGLGPEGNLFSKFMEGAQVGLPTGAAGEAGRELQTNPNASAVSTLNAAAEGGAGGFFAGGFLGMGIGAAKENFNPTPEHVQTRALSDVMPSSKEVLADKPPRDIAGQPRLQEGSGLFGSRTPTPTQLEKDAAAELAKIPGYQKATNGTALDRFNSTTKPLDALNVQLKTSLGQESYLQSGDDLYKKMVAAVEKESQTNPVLGTKVEDEGMVGRIGRQEFNVNNFKGTKFGNQLQSAAPYEPNFTDAGMNRYLQVLKATIKSVYSKGENGGMGNLADELEVKQRMDNYHKNSSGGRGKEFLSQADAPTKTLAIMNGTTRDALTEDIALNAKNTAVKPILKQEWDLLRARDMLWDKAGTEKATKVGRFVQGLPTPIRYLGRRAITGTALTATGLYAAARALAPKNSNPKMK